MTRYKQIGNKVTKLTTEEENALKIEEASYPSALDMVLRSFRQKRNILLEQTDWMANSDLTMSSDMKTYRQELRDITNGLNTVEKIKIKLKDFPTKPSGV